MYRKFSMAKDLDVVSQPKMYACYFFQDYDDQGTKISTMIAFGRITFANHRCTERLTFKLIDSYSALSASEQ